jgi:hypothetical protein
MPHPALTRALDRALAAGAPRYVNQPPATIYSQLVKLAKPVVTAYHEDVTVHDRRSCARMRIGDQIFWMANPCGTHLIMVRHDATEETLILNREYFRAVHNLHGHAREWKAARCTHDKGRGLVQHITDDAIESYFRGRIDRAQREEMSYAEIAAS